MSHHIRDVHFDVAIVAHHAVDARRERVTDLLEGHITTPGGWTTRFTREWLDLRTDFGTNIGIGHDENYHGHTAGNRPARASTTLNQPGTAQRGGPVKQRRSRTRRICRQIRSGALLRVPSCRTIAARRYANKKRVSTRCVGAVCASFCYYAAFFAV
jgi:hypothetical protein